MMGDVTNISSLPGNRQRVHRLVCTINGPEQAGSLKATDHPSRGYYEFGDLPHRIAFKSIAEIGRAHQGYSGPEKRLGEFCRLAD
jgi:hypothetical protein